MKDYSIYEALLGIEGLSISDWQLSATRIDVYCLVKNDVTNRTCPNCGESADTVNQYTTRLIRDLDISGREVWLHVRVRQWYCQACNRYFQESLSFADLGKSYTHRQAKYIFLLCRKQAYTEVGAITNTHAKTVERIVLAHSAKVIDIPARYAKVRKLGIDEHSHYKGRGSYLCVLTDLETGQIVDILPNRKKETLVEHFKALGADWCAQIIAVSCDVWEAYITAAKECFPNAYVALDRFHVTKLLNQCLDTYRKHLRTTDTENPHFKQLKWLLFKQYHTLSDKELEVLHAAFEANPRLEILYKKREAFHHILDNTRNLDTALTQILQWQSSLVREGITEFDKFVKLLDTKRTLVVNYVTDLVTNAVTEGLNNLIRSIRRVSFGLSNFNNLRLRAIALST